MFPISACVFIRNNFQGAFCLLESMAMLLPVVSEFIVMDLGSDDSTLEVLQQLSFENKKVKLVQGVFEYNDAGIFAKLANDLIAMCSYPHVLYYQSDEVWHESLVKLMVERFRNNQYDLAFWRIQFQENFQKVKWYPHPVHRVGPKDNFVFDGDGMNSNRVFGCPVCSNYDMGWFTKWGDIGKANPLDLPVNEMITDVSMIGAFLGNIPDRRRLHAPFWHEQPTLKRLEDGREIPVDEWYKEELRNDNWFKTSTIFDIPKTLKYHLGKQRYMFWSDLYEALLDDKTAEFLELGLSEH